MTSCKSSSFETRQSKLERIINNCYFEPGGWTEADEYFAKLWNEQPKESLDLLSAIVSTHLDDEHMLEGVLHILSSLPYPEIMPTCISICVACSSNCSPLVIDRLISCFEDWGNPVAISTLESMNLSDIPWLANYRNHVVTMLKKKNS